MHINPNSTLHFTETLGHYSDEEHLPAYFSG
jgi:hypothetical protein